MSEFAVGKQLLACLMADPEGATKFLRMKLDEGAFYGSEAELYAQCRKHMEKYGALPSPDTIGLEVEAPEPFEYYADQVRDRHRYRQAVRLLESASEHLRGDNRDVDKSIETLQHGLMELVLQRHGKDIIDFTREGGEIIAREYLLKQKLGNEYGIAVGWPYLDTMLAGGLQAGDVMAIVGRPAAGKTYNTLFMANHVWHQHRRVPMFVSMEIKPTPLLQRIAAMYTHKSISELRAAKMATKTKNKMFAQLDALRDSHPPYWVVDGNLAATPQDIVMLARQLRPNVVYIDGAYLLRSSNWRLSRWERIAENLEYVKEVLAGEMGIPTVMSYQFNRDAAKKHRKSTGLEDIAGADQIGQIASVVLGLFEDDTVETMTRKTVEVLKGRNGEIGEFSINWVFDDWPYMDFSEIQDVDDSELMYL